MEELHLLGELHRLTARLGIEIRPAQGEFAGGICRINGRSVFLINASLPRSRQVEVLCRELAHQDLSQVFVLPAVRVKLERMTVG